MSQVTELLVRIRQQGDDQLVKLQNTFKTLGQQTAAANVNFKELAQELKKVQAGSAQSINNLKGYASAWREIANSVDTTSDEFRIARQEADALDAKLNGFQNNQRAVATNFRNIASAANQAAAAMRTTTGLLRDPLTGAYRGVAGTTQYGAPIGPVMPPDYAGRIAQQQREADAQARRDARRRQIMEQRAAYAGEILGTRDPRTGALIAGGTGQFRAVGTQYAQPIGPALPPAARRRLSLGQIAGTAGTISAAGIFGGVEGLLGAGIGAAFGGPLGAATGGAIGAQLGMARQALGGTATYAAEIAKQRQALQLVTKDAGEYQRALRFIDKTSRDFAIPQEILTRQFTQLTASVKGAGGNVRDAETAFKGIASGIRGTGGSLEQLDSALTATSQVFSKGKVSAEELRQQIGERLPGAFSLFAKSMGKTPQELDKMLEKGQVSLLDFQKFADALFKQYGENAKIIADGPDAAGDRLRTSLSRLSESVGKLLKPIGAGFQNIFTDIVNVIDKAVRKFNEFAAVVGKKDLARMKTELAAQSKLVQDYEKAGAKKAQRGSILATEYAQAVGKEQRLRAQIQAATPAPTPPPGKEPPSKLPGIVADTSKDSKAAANKLQTEFGRTIDILSRRLSNKARAALLNNILISEGQIQKALKTGNLTEANRLRIEQERTGLVLTRNALIDQETALEEQILDGRKKGVDLTAAQIALQGIRIDREAAVAAILKKENDDAIAAALLVQQINETLPSYGKEGVEPITMFGRMKEEIEALKNSFADIQPQLIGLADGLANSFSNAFSSLVFSAQSARETLAQLFGDIAKSFQNMVIQMITDYLKLQIMTFFQNLFAPSLPGIGGNYFGSGASSTFTNPSFAAGNIGSSLSTQTGLANPLQYAGVKFAMGGIMTGNGPLKLRRYAAGGIASGAQLAMFGEGSRPEAYVPLPDGRTIPVTMKNGGGTSVVVNVDASGSSVQGNQPDAAALGRVVGAAVQAELIKQKRPGGLLT